MSQKVRKKKNKNKKQKAKKENKKKRKKKPTHKQTNSIKCNYLRIKQNKFIIFTNTVKNTKVIK
jgi:hypothetical protein